MCTIHPFPATGGARAAAAAVKSRKAGSDLPIAACSSLEQSHHSNAARALLLHVGRGVSELHAECARGRSLGTRRRRRRRRPSRPTRPTLPIYERSRYLPSDRSGHDLSTAPLRAIFPPRVGDRCVPVCVSMKMLSSRVGQRPPFVFMCVGADRGTLRSS